MSKKANNRAIELFVLDVLVAVDKIRNYTGIFGDKADFRHSPLHWDATIRQFEVMGEALKNLLENDSFFSSAPKYFRKIVDLKNVITHGYFGIDLEEVWDITQNKLAKLSEDIFRIVISIKLDMMVALEYEIVEYQNVQDLQTVDFLESLKKKIESNNGATK